MVVVDNECFCDSIPPITMAPIEIRYILLLLQTGQEEIQDANIEKFLTM